MELEQLGVCKPFLAPRSPLPCPLHFYSQMPPCSAAPPRAALPVPIHRWAPKLLNVLFVSLELENLIFWRSEK